MTNSVPKLLRPVIKPGLPRKHDGSKLDQGSTCRLRVVVPSWLLQKHDEQNSNVLRANSMRKVFFRAHVILVVAALLDSSGSAQSQDNRDQTAAAGPQNSKPSGISRWLEISSLS